MGARLFVRTVRLENMLSRVAAGQPKLMMRATGGGCDEVAKRLGYWIARYARKAVGSGWLHIRE